MFMRRVKKKHSVLVGFLAVALVLLLGTGSLSLPVYAANGTVYTCAITPCYQHPVTGVIEDSGGEASYVTGQGMVEGAVYDTGILEVPDGLYVEPQLLGSECWRYGVDDAGYWRDGKRNR